MRNNVKPFAIHRWLFFKRSRRSMWQRDNVWTYILSYSAWLRSNANSIIPASRISQRFFFSFLILPHWQRDNLSSRGMSHYSTRNVTAIVAFHARSPHNGFIFHFRRWTVGLGAADAIARCYSKILAVKRGRTGNKSRAEPEKGRDLPATVAAALSPPPSFPVHGIRYQYARYDSATSRAHPSTYCGLAPSTHAAVFVPTDTAVAHPENTFPRWLLVAPYTSALRPKPLNCFRHKSRYSRRIYMYTPRITFRRLPGSAFLSILGRERCSWITRATRAINPPRW